MSKKTLPHLTTGLSGAGWIHPYGHAPFSPVLYADGGAGDGGGSGSSGQSGAGNEGGEGGQGGTGDGGAAGGTQGQGSSQQSGAEGQAGSGAGSEPDWKAEARKWEKRAKDNSTATEELEKLKAAQLSEQEKAVAAAEKAGRTAAASEAQAEIDKRDAELRELKVEGAVRDRASTQGAKPAALLNSLTFRARIKALDPSDKTFGANLDEAIKAELEAHPEYAVQRAGQSGGDFSAGTGERGAKRSGSLSGAISNHYQT
ncbi:hypothetical protein [Streptomyces sp. NPDC047042]|uniref:hypothetical protein n=1 Tax=Streptomyces sp. NPDC047042 TaxID=3154807 RepID=UPI0033C48F9C